MKHSDIRAAGAKPGRPVVVSSNPEARVIALDLPAGRTLSEHEVHERAWIVILEGEIELRLGTGEGDRETFLAGPGEMIELDPGERHEVHARSDARFWLFLAPWPGRGHPGATTHDEQAHGADQEQDEAVYERSHEEGTP